MKILTRTLIIILSAQFFTNRITELFFTEGNWSYVLGRIAICVPVYLITGAILTWAFETKVADLHFQGKKVGKMKEGDD